MTAVRRPPEEPHTDKRIILRGASFAMAGFVMRPLSRLPFLFIVGRIYGTAEFGRYVFAITVFEALGAFCRLGLKDNLFRFLAERPDAHQEVLTEALVAAGGLSTLVAVAVAAAAPEIGSALHAEPLWRMLAFLLPALPIFVATDLLFAATRFHRTVGYEILGRSIVEPLVITSGALGFGLAGVGARGLLIAYMAAQVLTLSVASFGVARRFHWSFPLAPLDIPRMRSMVLKSLPTGFADCVGLGFNTVGVLLTGSMLGDTALGVYGMAQNIETALSKVRQAFDMIVVPVVSRGLAERGDAQVVDQLRMIGRSILTVQLPLLAIILLFGADILGLFGKGFRTGAALLGLMALAAVIDGVVNLAQVPLFLSRPKVNLAIAASALGMNLGLGLLLTPLLGVAGIGLAIVISLTISGLVRQLLVARTFGKSLLSLESWRPFLAGVGATAVSALILHLLSDGPIHHALAAICLALSYVALLGLLDPKLRRDVIGWARNRL